MFMCLLNTSNLVSIQLKQPIRESSHEYIYRLTSSQLCLALAGRTCLPAGRPRTQSCVTLLYLSTDWITAPNRIDVYCRNASSHSLWLPGRSVSRPLEQACNDDGCRCPASRCALTAAGSAYQRDDLACLCCCL